MKKIISIISVLAVSSFLSAQTLRMTSVHIDEQKELRPRNNHLIYGVGFTSYPDEGKNFTNTLIMLGYYKTDVFYNNTLGLYLNITAGANRVDGSGITIGATYKYIEKGDNSLYFIGGIGVATYREEKTYSYQYSWMDSPGIRYDYNSNQKLRIEAGALYNYKRFDVRATLGLPDYFSIGFGYRFGFNF